MNQNLKKAGKILAVIVTPTVVLVLVVLIWYLLKRSKRKKEEKQSGFTGENDHNKCPICGEAVVMQCKCGGPVKHTIESLKRGHGAVCKNNHRWSYQTEDGKVIVLEQL